MFGLSRFIPMIAHGSVMHVKLKLWLPMNWSTASFAPTGRCAGFAIWPFRCMMLLAGKCFKDLILAKIPGLLENRLA